MIHRIWHYTNGLRIDEILTSGVIQLATAGIGKNERAAAWFSTNPVWDMSASKGGLFLAAPTDVAETSMFSINDFKDDPSWTLEDMDVTFHGRFRIGVPPDAAQHGWETYKRLSGINRQVAAAMESLDPKKHGDVREFRASFRPVPNKLWKTCEKLENGVWVTYAEVAPVDGRTLSKVA